MAKEFKTIDELVALLQARGVGTDADTKPAIERESYYAIVNGYKGPFLDRHAMQSSSGDVYAKGTEFKWMYNLFLFDRDLRSLTFKYLVRAEAAMRTAVAYAFSKSHQSDNAYLDRGNFCAANDYLVPRSFAGNKAALHNQNIVRLMTLLNRKLQVNNRTRDFIRHYVQTYNKVPLWVLVNDLTFGNIVNFYQLMQTNDRNAVCSIIAKGVSWDSKKNGTLSPRKLLRTCDVLKGFRNICAHDERLYCAQVEEASLGDMVKLLGNIIPEDERYNYVLELVLTWQVYANRTYIVPIGELLADMGFDIDEVLDDLKNLREIR